MVQDLVFSEAQRESLDLSAGVGDCQLLSSEACFKPKLISCASSKFHREVPWDMAVGIIWTGQASASTLTLSPYLSSQWWHSECLSDDQEARDWTVRTSSGVQCC